MGASKSINVTGTSKNTATPSASGSKTFTHFQVFAANGTTPKSNPTLLTNSQTIDTTAGGLLNVADAGIKVQLGVAGNAVVGQLADAILISMLDGNGTQLFLGTDVIKFGTSAAMADSTVIPAFTVDAWDAAVAF